MAENSGDLKFVLVCILISKDFVVFIVGIRCVVSQRVDQLATYLTDSWQCCGRIRDGSSILQSLLVLLFGSR